MESSSLTTTVVSSKPRVSGTDAADAARILFVDLMLPQSRRERIACTKTDVADAAVLASEDKTLYLRPQQKKSPGIHPT